MGTAPIADAAFRKVFDATFDDVRRFCLRRVPLSDVNDAVSEVYLAAWRKADKMPVGSETLPWLYGVARNVVRHIERGNWRRFRLDALAMREPAAAVEAPEIQVIRRSEDAKLAAAIRRLSKRDQDAIRLRAWEELSSPDIAHVLGISVSAAEKRVTRAFKRLEKTLGAWNGVTTRRATVTKRGDT